MRSLPILYRGIFARLRVVGGFDSERYVRVSANG
jgi:hypothetical protein